MEDPEEPGPDPGIKPAMAMAVACERIPFPSLPGQEVPLPEEGLRPTEEGRGLGIEGASRVGGTLEGLDGAGEHPPVPGPLLPDPVPPKGSGLLGEDRDAQGRHRPEEP